MSQNCNLCVYHTGGACDKSQCDGDITLLEFSHMIYNQALEDLKSKIDDEYYDGGYGDYHEVEMIVRMIEQIKR